MERSSSQLVSCFLEAMQKESVYSMRQSETIKANIERALMQNRPVSFGCFVCLPIDFKLDAGSPRYFVGDWKTRLERSKNTKRLVDLKSTLEKTGVPICMNFTIADTDMFDVYGKWLANTGVDPGLTSFGRRISALLNFAENTEVSFWSQIQAPYQVEYERNFTTVKNKILSFVSESYLQESVQRRINFFERKGVTINQETKSIAVETATNNIALYAAQGPIIRRVFDCLIIADPDPQRMGMIQSLVAPDLGIIYPVKE